MAFDNSKYDVELAGVGLRVENYRKSEADTFIPRLGSGSQTESEFDLLRSRSLVDFSGGMLQRFWEDDHAFFGSESLFPIYGDSVLYPVKQMSALTNLMSTGAVTATCQSGDYLWVALNYLTGGTFTMIRRIDTAGNIVAITLPSAVSTASFAVTSMVVWNNQVWCSQGTGLSLFYFDVTSTSASLVGAAGSNGPYRMVVWQGALYGTGSGTNDINVTLYRYAGTTSSQVWTSVGVVESHVSDYYATLLKFNGRIILCRSDGIYAYDGIRLASLDDSSSNVNLRNYRFPSVLKGYLYFWMQDGMYRYNGSMIEKLYDIAEIGFPKSVCVGKNRLWIVYSNSAYSGSSRYDKSMGYDYSSGTAINGRIAVFDGKAIYTYARTTNDGKPGVEDVTGQGENDLSVWFNDKLYVFTYYSKTNSGLYFTASTNETAATGTASWRLITSIFDADFPMIYKGVENIEFVFDGDVSADESIAIEYRTSGFVGSTGWLSLGTISTQTKTLFDVYSALPAGLKFKQIQFRFTGTTAVTYGIKKIVFRYLLVPDMRWQWTFVANCLGDNPLEPLMLKDGSQSTQSVALLRGNVYDSRITGVPIGFTDMDQFDLSGAHSNSVTTITLNSTQMLKNSGFVRIDDEVIKYTSKTSTQLQNCTRGVMGTSAASHADNAAVFAYYRALVRKLQQEQIIMDDSNLDRTEDKAIPSQIAIVLQEV